MLLQGKRHAPKPAPGLSKAVYGGVQKWEDLAMAPLWLSDLLQTALEEGGTRHKLVWSNPAAAGIDIHVSTLDLEAFSCTVWAFTSM